MGSSIAAGCGVEPPGEDGSETLAATVPTGFAESLVTGGLSNPTTMSFAPDGRLFVSEQGGALRVIKNGVLLPTPFLTLAVQSDGERGLLGVTFDPAFTTNHLVYVYYTTTSPTTHNRLSRFTANGDVAVAGSEQILFDLDNLSSATNHNGGSIHFGPDGKIYVAVGENANGANSQSFSTVLGKLLRLNSDGSSPTDNPFFATTTGKNRAIWALGLRNPFTFAFQPGTGKLFINDVGQSTWEEVDVGMAGANYGWPTTEGATTDPRFVGPLYTYAHTTGSPTGCAITGGTFYNPTVQNFPSSYVGHYFFADYCSGWIQELDPATGHLVSQFASGISSPVDLQVGPDGALYHLARGASSIFRIAFSQNTPPSITVQPTSVTIAVGQSATFSVAATGTAPLAYQWQRNGASIAGATGASYTASGVTAADSGATFRVIVTNGFGSVTSNAATLTVTANMAPTATITAPAAGATYAAGDTITYTGTGTDPEDGTLPASAFHWQVVFHHDTHTHPFIDAVDGVKGGTFVIPTSGETSTNVWYRIHLTVTDSNGLTSMTTRDILPRTANLAFTTSPAGLALTLDGQPIASGAVVGSVVGMTRSLGAPSPQTVSGVTYAFAGWSDGGAATHNIATPAAATTYTATFTPVATTTGLRGEYYDNADLTNLKVVRIDPQINFDWGSGQPDPAVGADTFSVRWTGTIRPQLSETYTFYTTSDDGVRLWINGQLIIDNWTLHGATENSGTIALTAGQRVDVRMEMYENQGLAVAKLAWSSPSLPKQIVPATSVAPLTLAVSFVSNGKAYARTTAAIGAKLYIDRVYVITDLSAALAGGLMVQAANDDKAVTTTPHLTLQLSNPATVYLAYDPRATSLPAWLTDGSWTLTNLSMTTTDGIGSLGRKIWRKDVGAGPLSLGGNLQPPAAGAGDAYTVIAVPR